MADVATEEARQRMIAKRFGGQTNVRTGGKGSVRRKKKAVHKTSSTDDKKLTTTLKKLGVNQIPGIEEVNIFRDNGEVIHFANPKVQASINSNTYVVSGTAETKRLQDMLPGVLSQLGPDMLNSLKSIGSAGAGGANPGAMASMAAAMGGMDAMAAAAAMGGPMAASAPAAGGATVEEDVDDVDDDDDDDDVPDLVEDFEEAADK